MNKTNINNKYMFNKIVYYILLALASSVICFFVLNLWEANLSVPFTFSQDGIGWSVIVKNIIDGGSPYKYVNLGAPFDNTWDYMPDFNLALTIVVRILSIFTNRFGIIINFIFLLSIVLVAWTCAYSLIKCDVNRWIAFGLSLMYTNLPYHYYRGTQHLNLSCYFLVPIVCMVILKIFKDEEFSRKSYIMISVLFFLLGMSDLYYTYFSLLIMVCVVIIKLIQTHNMKGIKPFLCSLISSILGLATCFVVWFCSRGNINSISTMDNRNLYDLEIYGLKISSLIMPVKGHLFPLFNKFTENYVNSTPFNEEGVFAALGLVGAIGLIVSIIAVLINDKKKENIIAKCGTVNLIIIIIAVNAGLSVIIAQLVTHAIRCYNRLSIYIAFYSFLTIGLLLNEVIKKSNKHRLIKIIIVSMLFFVGLIDQVSVDNIPRYSSNREKYDEAFAVGDFFTRENIEGNVYFYPFQSTNDFSQMNQRDRYEMYLPCLFTKADIKWSVYYGNEKRDEWANDIISGGIESMWTKLKDNQFIGVLVDTYLLEDGCYSLDQFIQLFGEAQYISANQRYYYFNIIYN